MDLFGWAIEIADNQNRVGTGPGICSDDVVASKQSGEIDRFGGNEAESVTPVMAQEPAHRSVAEHAVAVEDYQEPVAEFWKAAHYHADAK